MKKVRNKKLNIPPGKSVTSLDFKDIVAENIKKTKPIKRTPCADDAGPSGSIQPKKKQRKDAWSVKILHLQNTVTKK